MEKKFEIKAESYNAWYETQAEAMAHVNETQEDVRLFVWPNPFFPEYLGRWSVISGWQLENDSDGIEGFTAVWPFDGEEYGKNFSDDALALDWAKENAGFVIRWPDAEILDNGNWKADFELIQDALENGWNLYVWDYSHKLLSYTYTEAIALNEPIWIGENGKEFKIFEPA